MWPNHPKAPLLLLHDLNTLKRLDFFGHIDSVNAKVHFNRYNAY